MSIEPPETGADAPPDEETDGAEEDEALCAAVIRALFTAPATIFAPSANAVRGAAFPAPCAPLPKPAAPLFSASR